MIPDLLSFAPLLGKTETDLVEFVRPLGYDLRLNMEPGEHTANFNMKPLGIDMRFVDRGVAEDAGGATGMMILATVGFFADGAEGFSGFSGALPHGRSMAMSRADVRQALGEPVKSGGGKKFRTFTSKEWDGYPFDGYSLTVFYNPVSQATVSITITLPAYASR